MTNIFEFIASKTIFLSEWELKKISHPRLKKKKIQIVIPNLDFVCIIEKERKKILNTVVTEYLQMGHKCTLQR